MPPRATLMMLAGLGGCATVPNLGATPEAAQPGASMLARSLAGTSQNWPTDSGWQESGDRQLDAGERCADGFPRLPAHGAKRGIKT